MRRDVWSAELLRYCRCACLTAAELDSLEAAAAAAAPTPAPAAEQATILSPQSRPADVLHKWRSPAGDDPGGSKVTAARVPTTAHCAPRSADEVPGKQETSEGSGDTTRTQRTAIAEADAHPSSVSREACEDSNIMRPVSQDNASPGGVKYTLLRNGRQRGRGEQVATGEENTKNSEADGEQRERKDGKHEVKSERHEGGTGRGGGRGRGEGRESRFPVRALSAQNEVAALTAAMEYLAHSGDMFPTTLEQDEARMADDRKQGLCVAKPFETRLYTIQLNPNGAAKFRGAEYAYFVFDVASRTRMTRAFTCCAPKRPEQSTPFCGRESPTST